MRRLPASVDDERQHGAGQIASRAAGSSSITAGTFGHDVRQHGGAAEQCRRVRRDRRRPARNAISRPLTECPDCAIAAFTTNSPTNSTSRCQSTRPSISRDAISPADQQHAGAGERDDLARPRREQERAITTPSRPRSLCAVCQRSNGGASIRDGRDSRAPPPPIHERDRPARRRQARRSAGTPPSSRYPANDSSSVCADQHVLRVADQRRGRARRWRRMPAPAGREPGSAVAARRSRQHRRHRQAHDVVGENRREPAGGDDDERRAGPRGVCSRRPAGA